MVSLLVNVGLALSLLSGALSQPIHHIHARDNVVVTVTHWVTAGAEGAAATPLAAPAADNNANVAPAPADGGVTVVSSPAVADPGSAPAAASPDASAANSAAASPVAADSSSGSGAVAAGSSGALGITYSPYTAGGACKSAEEVASDLAQLRDFGIIRIYGTDCNQVANVYAAKAANQKLFLGIYDVGSIEDNCQALHAGINGDWGCVHTVSIGNELVNSGQASVAQIGDYVSRGRAALQGLGYSGPVVSVDTFIAVINNPGLCQISDYMAVNAHAYFDGNVASSGAGAWTAEQIQRVSSACGGKNVVITESGWPKQGSSNGAAYASLNDQKTAIQSIKDSAGSQVILFNAFNDYWKHPGYLGCEQYWGVLDN